MTDVDKKGPLSGKNILAFLGINLTIGSLLSVFANIIQLLTITNGFVIFGSVFLITAIYYINQIRNHQKNLSENIFEVQTRLEKITFALKTRFSGNPRPDLVLTWVNTKKFIAKGKTITILRITEDSLVLDKGGKDGLISKMPCIIKKKG